MAKPITADDVEMEALNKDDSSKLLDTPEVEQETPRDLHSPNEEEQKLKQEEARKRFKEEREINEALDSGDLDEILKRITPQTLTECTVTNCIEKSFEVSYRLKELGKSKGSNAKEFNHLATQVEDFAFKLLEPLKNDDLKRAIFQEKIVDSVSDKALKYRQKKFVSHPVYDLLMRQRWMGYFYQLKYSNIKKDWFKWFLINFWTFFDVFLFPVVHVLLWVIHLISEFAMKRRAIPDVSIIFYDSRARQATKLKATAKDIDAKLKGKNIRMKKTDEGATSSNLRGSEQEGNNKVNFAKNTGVRYDDQSNKLLEDVTRLQNEQNVSKVLLAKTIGVRYDDPRNKLLEDVARLKEEKKVNKVIVVAYIKSIHLNHHCTHFKNLETIATKDENVFMVFCGDKQEDQDTVIEGILKCIKGKDIYDRYVQYFNTPYFIFFRDTVSYLVLFVLHFAMCLQPSTLHFTAVEWIISVFFLGRLMMEINEVITANAGETPKQEVKEEKEERSCKKLRKVMSAYFNDWWNILDVVTLIVFLVIVGLRAFIWSQHSSVSKNRLLAVGAYLYGLNAMFLTLRVFGHIMEYKESTGSIQIALFHVIRAVMIIFGQFAATTLAFSLAVTKIYIAEVSYSSGKNATSTGLCKSQSGLHCWWSFTRHLTWSLLGIAELDPLESSDDTSDLLAKILYGVFLIMGVVMLMNMMIALLSNTYQQVQNNSFYEWSYKKATTIRTYSKYHPVSVPYNIVSLSFILIRYIYRSSTRSDNPKEKPTEKENMLWHRLEIEYFAKYGQKFLMTETESNRKMIGYIAERAFLSDQEKNQQSLQRYKQPNKWKTKGVAVIGQRLENDEASCSECNKQGKVNSHTAIYLDPLSPECPEFEVLIQEIGEKRMVAIGVVTEGRANHKFPGWEKNTAGYHIDNGKIFDSDDYRGRDGVDAMAYRGDLIGCKILYDKQKDGKLPVSFTLNGRVVGEAKVNAYHDDGPCSLYPCVGIGWKGISVLFRLCPRRENVHVIQNDDTSEQQTKLLSTTRSTDTDTVIRMLQTISSELQTMSKKQIELERKIDHMSRADYRKES